MNRVLVFKTSTDITIKKLFEELKKEEIDCLIQSSQVDIYKSGYPSIHFIDICQDSFYDVPECVVYRICSKAYDQVYVTFSGIKGHNYGNIMELLDKINYKRAFFYNCNGDRVEIPKKHAVKDFICRLYIKLVGFIYELRG